MQAGLEEKEVLNHTILPLKVIFVKKVRELEKLTFFKYRKEVIKRRRSIPYNHFSRDSLLSALLEKLAVILRVRLL